MKINIIAAIGQNNEIGLNNELLWHSKSDLEHFKQLTLGKPIIMGRKTFESLPGILPGRPHYVITKEHMERNNAFHSAQVMFVPSLDICLSMQNSDEVFIIGGASIFEQSLPLADELHISHMDWEGEADTFFPTIGPEWSASTNHMHTSTNGLDWQYLRYTRT